MEEGGRIVVWRIGVRRGRVCRGRGEVRCTW